MDNQELSQHLTNAFNQLTNNRKIAMRLPKCEICGAYCRNIAIHKEFKYNIK